MCVLPHNSPEQQKNVCWDSSSAAPAGGAVDMDNSLSHGQPKKKKKFNIHDKHSVLIFENHIQHFKNLNK